MNSEHNGNHPKRRIFLSYARTDDKDAHRVRTLLEALPNTSVFTSDSLSTGESWTTRLREELQRSDLFMLLLSAGSLQSQYVIGELGAAWALGKRIIPIRTETGGDLILPVEVKNLQTLELSDFDQPERVRQALEKAA